MAYSTQIQASSPLLAELEALHEGLKSCLKDGDQQYNSRREFLLNCKYLGLEPKYGMKPHGAVEKYKQTSKEMPKS